MDYRRPEFGFKGLHSFKFSIKPITLTDNVITGATVCAGQTAVHAVGVLRVGLSMLTGKTNPLFLIFDTFLMHKGSCTSDTKKVKKL